MYQVLGITSAVLLGIITSPYWLRKLNQWFFHIKGKPYLQLIKFLRRLHKPLGIALLLVLLIHGYLALGALRLHTGSIAFLAVLFTASLGGAFYKWKKPVLLKWHRRAALIVVAFVLIHLIFPNAIYYLFH